ncbi:MAG TPA: hypothetical protein VEH27_01650 [Methylomirabilota bacterium]|nr:hypothetical protein [Methylomirabilota bacterium]
MSNSPSGWFYRAVATLLFVVFMANSPRAAAQDCPNILEPFPVLSFSAASRVNGPVGHSSPAAGEVRRAYAFQIPSNHAEILWAELWVRAGLVRIEKSEAILQLHDVTSSIEAGDPASIFADLGTGTLFASASVRQSDGSRAFPRDAGALLRLRFNAAGLAQLASAKGKRWWAGLRLAGSGPEDYALHTPGWLEPAPAQLLIGYANASAPQVAMHGVRPAPMMGAHVVLSATICGEQPVALQWHKDQVPIPGATGMILQIPNFSAADEGYYSLRASNRFGAATAGLQVQGKALELTVTIPPEASFRLGGRLYLSADAASVLPLSYQWRKNGVPIPGATGPQLYINGFSQQDVGNYDAILRNAAGALTTAVSRVTALGAVAPVLRTAPIVVHSVTVGEFTSFTFPLIEGTQPVNVTWFKDGLPAPHLGNRQEVHIATAQPSDAGVYSVRVENSAGFATGEVLRLEVLPLRVSIEGPPQQPATGDSVRLTASVFPPLDTEYQWFHNGVKLPGATNRILNIASVSTAHLGAYTVEAKNIHGSRASAEHQLAFSPEPPLMFIHPLRASVAGDQQLLYAINAPGGVVSWQWHRNGIPIVNGTNSSLYFPALAPSDQGVYTLRAQTPQGLRESHTFSLIVEAGPPPVLLSERASGHIAGRSALLRVQAPANAHLQWSHNGTPIPGQTNRTLILSKTTLADSGAYELRASNSSGETRLTNYINLRPATAFDNWEWLLPRPQGSRLNSVAWGNGLFVAVGKAGNIVTSEDGMDWATTIFDPTVTLEEVRFEDGEFIARGEGYTLASEHGRTWRPVSYAELGFQFEARNESVRLGWDGMALWRSTNGQPWQLTLPPSPGESVSALAYGNGRFVAAIFTSFRTSVDGLEWASSTTPFSYARSLAYAFGKFYAVAYEPGHFMPKVVSSADGLDWREVATGDVGIVKKVQAAGDALVLLCERGLVAVSTNGIDWETIDTGVGQDLNSIVFAQDRYLAVGGAGAITSSTDLKHWSGHDPLIRVDLFGLASGATNAIAVGEYGTILVTGDGRSWAAAPSGVTRYLHSAAYGNGTYVVVGRQGMLLTSSDGIQWRRQASGTSHDLQRVEHANGQWVVTAVRGVILTSSDTFNWTVHSTERMTSSPTDHEGAAYGNGVWVVVGGHFEGGAVPTCFVSSDATTWVPAAVPAGVRMRDVAFANGQFVAVGNDGLVANSQDGRTWEISHTGGGNFRRIRKIDKTWLAVGNDGRMASTETPTILSSWLKRDPATSQNFHDITAFAGAVLAVGNNGMVMRSSPLGARIESARFAGGALRMEIANLSPESPVHLERSVDLKTWQALPNSLAPVVTLPASERVEFFRLQPGAP